MVDDTHRGFSHAERVSREGAEDRFESMLIDLVGRVPGEELDYARKSWREALVLQPRNEDGHVLVSLSDNRRIVVFEVPFVELLSMADAMGKAFAAMREHDGIDVTEDGMTAACASAIKEALDIMPAMQHLSEDARPEKYHRATDMAVGTLFHIYKVGLKERRNEEPRADNNVLFGHVLRQTSGGLGLLYSTVRKSPRA